MRKLILLLSAVTAAVAYETGAPPATCGNMTPDHGATIQDPNSFPYSVQVDKQNIKPGEKVRVTISGNGKNTFKGFLLQARVGNSIVGQFEPQQLVKLIDCDPGTKNAATHDSPVAKDKIDLTWVSPPGLGEKVQFYVTVVKDGGTYWVAIPTQVVTVS